MMQIDSTNILSYLPQRPPFVMVSSLENAMEGEFETNFFVEADNVLVENGKLTEFALIENIAQTCAVGFGYIDHLSGEKGKIGYIGSISKVKVHQLPPIKSTIATKVIVTFQLGNIFVIKGENFLDGEKLLECEMKIVVQ